LVYNRNFLYQLKFKLVIIC